MAAVKPVDVNLPSLRTSERRDFKRCPQRWWWGWRDGLKPQHTKNPFWFGTGVHEALAAWYLKGSKRGPHPAETWEKYCKDESRYVPQDFEEDQMKLVDAIELGRVMLNGYVEHWGRDDNWDVLLTERSFRYLLRVGGKAVANYLGTFDGAYRDRRTGEIWLMEHKTASGIRTLHLPLDDQAGSYLMVVTAVLRKQRVIGPEETVVGIMYNFLDKKMPDDRPINEDGLRTNLPKKANYLAAFAKAGFTEFNSKSGLDDLAAIAQERGITVYGDPSARQPGALFVREPVHRSLGDQRNMHDRVAAEVAAMRMFDEGVLQLYKNPTTDCSWDCDFYRMCQLHESGDDWEEYREAAFNRRDPYADHRATRKHA